MARKIASKKSANKSSRKNISREERDRKSKAAPKGRMATRGRPKSDAFTSKGEWKRVAARRWPAANRPLARAQETEGRNLSPAAPAPGAGGASVAAARLAAMQQVGTAPSPAGAPPAAAAPGEDNWTPLGPLAIPSGQTYGSGRVLVSGRVTAIAIDPTAPDTIYLGAAQGGIWKSIDNGANWEPKTDDEVSLAIGALALDPNSPNIVYVGTGEGNFAQDSYYGLGILKSVDGGRTWANLASATFEQTRFGRLIVDSSSGNPATRLFAATQIGIYRSIDGGAKWDPLTNGLPANVGATDIALDPATGTLYAAFWGAGIYKSTNANAPDPTFTQLTAGLPVATAPLPDGVTRIALGMSPTNPSIVFALMANNDTTNYQQDGPPYAYAIDKFYVTTDGGMSWAPITLPGPVTDGIGGQGFYDIAVNVDPTTPDIVYLSAISLWKAVKSGNTWTLTDIGGAFHADNHALAFRPGDHLQLWAGSDGGIYKSGDGGATWDDKANKGLCISQMEFIDQHPQSPAIVFGGTQDNGTEQYRGSPVFTHADDGDGGFVIVNQNDPTHVLSTYYLPSPKRSVEGGKLGTWTSVAAGLGGNGSLFYPPMTACRTNVNALALGTTVVNIDPAEGTGQWTTQVPLPGLVEDEFVSTLSYVNANLIYAATNGGKVFRLSLAKAWTSTLISAPPLPAANVTDLSPLPGKADTIIAVMGDFNHGHVWRGVVPAKGVATWTDISGTLRDIPVNALAIDPRDANRIFIGTDIGVFETRNGGANWSIISASSSGLPNCAVFDLRLHAATRMLRAATHGRGLWEKPVDAPSTPAADIYVRRHSMDTAREFPPRSGIAAAFEDGLRYIALGDLQYPWLCADIKIDALEGAVPSFQMPISDVDYVAFEAKLQDRGPQPTRVNRVYVQLVNRGFQAALNVNVKLLWADAAAGLPDLPQDFWTAFPRNSGNTSQWRPIGSAHTIATFNPGLPNILEWDFTPPASASEHACLIVVMDSASDPIPPGNKVFDIGTLTATDKRIGLKNLHVMDPKQAPAAGIVAGILSFALKGGSQTIELVPHAGTPPRVSLIFTKQAIPANPKLVGIAAKAPSQALLKALTKKYGSAAMAAFDTATSYVLTSAAKPGSLSAALGSTTIRAVVAVEGAAPEKGGAAFSVLQLSGQQLVGGSTYAIKLP